MSAATSSSDPLLSLFPAAQIRLQPPPQVQLRPEPPPDPLMPLYTSCSHRGDGEASSLNNGDPDFDASMGPVGPIHTPRPPDHEHHPIAKENPETLLDEDSHTQTYTHATDDFGRLGLPTVSDAMILD